MSNTNFQTFHQMGSAINSVVRQATGRDNVQNIDMDYVTVAQNKRLMEEIITGNPASFVTNIVGPLDYLRAQINPVQDLHGYKNPWPEGGGKNLFNLLNVSQVFTVSEAEQSFTSPGSGYNRDIFTGVTGGDTAVGSEYFGKLPNLKAGTYCISFASSIVTSLHIKTVDSTTGAVTELKNATSGNTFTLSADSMITLRIDVSGAAKITKLQIESGSTATAYAPYSNICPISGWTGAKVVVSPTLNEEDGTTYNIAFPDTAGTVYGGSLTVNKDGSGKLVVDRVLKLLNDPAKWEATQSNTINFICFEDCSDRMKTAESFSGLLCSYMQVNPSLPSNTARWSDASGDYFGIKSEKLTIEQIKADAADGKIAISYPLATPVTYQLTNQQVIETLLGTNNIWADTGDVTVMYKNYEEVI